MFYGHVFLFFFEKQIRLNHEYFSIKKYLPRYVMRCAIWYHLHNLKNIKNTHGGVLILVKLQAFQI